MLDPNDNGIDSRKWRALFYSLSLVAAGGLAGVFVPAFHPIYGTFVEGVIGLYAIYCGVNVAGKWVTGSVNGKYFQAAAVDATKQNPPPSEKAGDPADDQNG